jgi:hypothetical protein
MKRLAASTTTAGGGAGLCGPGPRKSPHARELLEVEPLHVEKTIGVDIEDAERLMHHLDGLSVLHLDDQMCLANALAGELRDPTVILLAQHAHEDAAGQRVQGVVTRQQKYSGRQAHLLQRRSGRSRRSRSVPCQFEIRPSMPQFWQTQTTALSRATMASTSAFLHLKHAGATGASGAMLDA